MADQMFNGGWRLSPRDPVISVVGGVVAPGASLQVGMYESQHAQGYGGVHRYRNGPGGDGADPQ